MYWRAGVLIPLSIKLSSKTDSEEEINSLNSLKLLDFLQAAAEQLPLLELHPSFFNCFLQRGSWNNKKKKKKAMNKQVNVFGCERFIISGKSAVSSAGPKAPERSDHVTNALPPSHPASFPPTWNIQTTIGEMRYGDNNNLQFVNIRSGTPLHPHPHGRSCNSLFISLNKNAIIRPDCSRLWEV